MYSVSYKTHQQKSSLVWELQSYRQRNQIRSLLNTDNAKHLFRAKTGHIVNTLASDSAEHMWLTHSVSERKFITLFTNKDFSSELFSSSPYISCSVIKDDSESYRVNPSLLNLKIVIDTPSESIMYTADRDVWSPENTSSDKSTQRAFHHKLKQQLHFAHVQQTLFRSELDHTMLRDGDIRASHLHAQSRAQQHFNNDRVESFRPDKRERYLPLYPKFSPQTLYRKTQEADLTAWNEILVEENPSVRPVAIMISRYDLERGLAQAHQLGNQRAQQCLRIIRQLNLPIILLNPEIGYQPQTRQLPKLSEVDLIKLVKARDYTQLQTQLVRTPDLRLFSAKALQESCFLGDLNIMRLLLRHGIDANKEKGIALQTAVYRSDIRAVRLLCKQGAQVSPYQEQLYTLLQRRPNKQIQSYLSHRIGLENQRQPAIEQYDYEDFQPIMDNGVSNPFVKPVLLRR